MNWVAARAALTFAATGRITVVVQDNGSIHKSRKVQAQWDAWAKQGLIMFFLPPYCSEMNPIEAEWHQIKAHRIAGQMFNAAYDLAMAVVASVEHRYKAKQYRMERFIFNSP